MVEIWDRIRVARDRALDGGKSERQRIAEAGNAELQQTTPVRLAARQAVREPVNDVLDQSSDPEA